MEMKRTFVRFLPHKNKASHTKFYHTKPHKYFSKYHTNFSDRISTQSLCGKSHKNTKGALHCDVIENRVDPQYHNIIYRRPRETKNQKFQKLKSFPHLMFTHLLFHGPGPYTKRIVRDTMREREFAMHLCSEK
jgi:hypothetical protein